MNSFNVTQAMNIIMSILMKIRHPVDQELLYIAWHEYKQLGQQFILIIHNDLEYFGYDVLFQEIFEYYGSLVAKTAANRTKNDAI